MYANNPNQPGAVGPTSGPVSASPPGPTPHPTYGGPLPPAGGYASDPTMPPPPAGLDSPPPLGSGFGADTPTGPFKRKPVIPIVVGVAVVMFIAAGVFAALFFTTSSDLSSARSTIAEQEETITKADKKVEELGNDKSDLKDEVETLEGDSKGARECIDAFTAWLDEATKKKPSKSKIKDLAEKANAACQKYW